MLILLILLNVFLVGVVVWLCLVKPGSQATDRGAGSPGMERLRESSRQIRTSMNAMLGFAEILGSPSFRGLSETEFQEIVGIVKRNCDRVLKSLNDLLENKNSANVETEPAMESTPPSAVFVKELELSSDNRIKATLEQLIKVQAQTHYVGSASRPLADYRILLVEDVALNQLLTGFQLRELGAVVDIAENGQKGIEQIRREERENRYYDLVIMDMQMPVMDGYEATRQLRASGFMRPILALTANAMPGDREKTIDAGCNDYLTRPAAPKDLLESIQTLLFTFHETST